MKFSTKKIAGHTLTLEIGKSYRASRWLVVGHAYQKFTVRIDDVKAGSVAAEVEGLDYDAAIKLLAAFNNGDGRVWS